MASRKNTRKPRARKHARRSRTPSAQTPPEGPPRSPQEALEGDVLPLQLGHNGCMVSVRGTLWNVSAAVPGDHVRLSPLRSKGATPLAKIAALKTPSPDRVIAPCVQLDRCGGCSCQAMGYKRQLEAKRRALVDVLDGLCPAGRIGQVHGLKEHFGYRTRLLMQAAPASWSGKHPRGFKLGFFQRGSTELVPAMGCPVQHPLTLSTLAMTSQVLSTYPVHATAPNHQGGWLHGINVRVDPAQRLAELTLVGRTSKLPGGKRLAQQLAALPGVHSVHIAVNPERSSYLFDENFTHIGGARRTPFTLAGQQFHLSPGAFFQTCSAGAELLADAALRLLPDAMDGFADLYGGAGIFARLTQKRWRRALVVESNPHAVNDLRVFLKRHPLNGLRVLAQKVELAMDEVLRMTPEVVLLDPPRGGCHPAVLAALRELKPAAIIYIACGVNAFVRDSKALLKGGFVMERAEAVDMFPHTNHLEIVARFVPQHT